MRRTVQTLLLVVACMIFACMAGTPAQGSQPCRIARRAEVKLLLVDNHPLIDLTVDGKTATFLLDTGAERTVLADSAVREFGLARDPWVSSSIRGVGGVIEKTANAVLRSFEIGGVPLRRRSLSPALSFAVAPLPWDRVAGHRIFGLLGADYLAPFDIDLDLPGGKLSLYDTNFCAQAPIPWGPAYAAISLERPTPFAMLAPVGIGGQTLLAQIDTGASLSLIGPKGAAQLGVTADMLTANPARRVGGIGHETMELRSRTIETLRLGPAEFHNVSLAFALPVWDLPFDMLLGTDLLRNRRVFISYSTNRLLVATPAADAPH